MDSKSIEISVFSDIKRLAHHLSQTDSGKASVKLIYERLLTWNKKKKYSDNFPPLSQCSYLFRTKQLHEKADVIDHAIEKLYTIRGGWNANNLQSFLVTLANLNEQDLQPKFDSRPRIFVFQKLALNLPAPTSKRVLSFELQQIPTISPLPKIIGIDFPKLAAYENGLDSDEGFSESSSASASPIPPVITEEIAQPIQKPREDFVSQLSAADFVRVWSGRRNCEQSGLSATSRSPEIMIQFVELKRCVRALSCGDPSWLFERHDGAFQFRSGVTLLGISATTIRAIANDGIALGNCVCNMHCLVKALDAEQFSTRPTMQALRLGLKEILRLHYHRVDELFPVSTGPVDLINKCKTLYSSLRQVDELCRMVQVQLRTEEFKEIWLLDTLVEASKNFRTLQES